MDLNHIKEKFTEYVSQFDMTDEKIKLKVAHSFRVMQLCIEISKSENFDEMDINTSALIGLLHDYARFFQWTKYKTYSDLYSIDHGDAGVDFLFQDNGLREYTSDIRTYDEIYDGIKYHNKHSIPEYLSEHNKKLLQVVRDADKLDILYIFSSGDEKFREDGEISSFIKEAFSKRTSVLFQKKFTNSDMLLSRLAILFDLNYSYSFQVIKQKEYVQKMFSHIKDKEKFKPYFEEMLKFIEEQCVKI